MSEKTATCEFLGEEWRRMAEANLARLLEECADEVVGVNFSICEAFINVPSRVEPAGQVVWHFRMVDGVADYRMDTVLKPDDLLADVRLVMDSATAGPLATLVVGDDPVMAANLAELASDATARGAFRMSGIRPMPAFYHRFHDMNAASTTF